jgi:hypothetical protein
MCLVFLLHSYYYYLSATATPTSIANNLHIHYNMVPIKISYHYFIHHVVDAIAPTLALSLTI